MWIEERQTKKGLQYRYCERYTDITGTTKRVSITLNSNSRSTQKKAAQLLFEKIERAKTVKRENTKLTFENVAREWQDYDKLGKKVTTILNRDLHLKWALTLLPDNILLHDITVAHVEKMAYTLYYEKEFTYGYCKSIVQIVKRVMKYAKKRRLIRDIEDIMDVEIKRKPITPEEIEKKKKKFLDHDELRSCLNQLKTIHKRIGFMMELISRTGLRCGELLALRLQDYDKEHKRIHVTGTIVNSQSVNSKDLRGTPKNIYSIRYVDLDARSMAIIDHFILENKKRALWCKSYDEKGYIFTTNRGNPYNMQYIAHYLRKVEIDGKHLTTHIFRHTHISLLAEMNIPLKMIMVRVGHNDPATTLSIYTHVTESMQKEVVNKLNALSV